MARFESSTFMGVNKLITSNLIINQNHITIINNHPSLRPAHHRILNLFSKIANSLPILIHLFFVAINLEAVLLILPLLMYTLQAYLTSLDTWIVGLELERALGEGTWLGLVDGWRKDGGWVYWGVWMEEFVVIILWGIGIGDEILLWAFIQHISKLINLPLYFIIPRCPKLQYKRPNL